MPEEQEQDDRWDVNTATQCIKRNGGKITKNPMGKPVIEMDAPGIRVLGAIDYLRYKHKYAWVRV